MEKILGTFLILSSGMPFVFLGVYKTLQNILPIGLFG